METRVWDFNEAIGYSIKEKYEELTKFLNNVVNQDLNKHHCVKLITSPEISSIFEVSTKGFTPSIYACLGEIFFVGVVNDVHNYYLYKMDTMPKNQAILIGKETSICIEVKNFIV